MARPKNQTHRRAEMIAAAQRAISERGVAGLRLKDIAAEAGLSVGLVHYYYPDMDELVFAVHRKTIETFVEERRAVLGLAADPATRLTKVIRQGLPASRDDETFRLFYELHSLAGRSRAHAELMSSLWNRDVAVYVTLLEEGAATGAFSLRTAAEVIAKRMVAFEDGLSVQVLSDNPALDIEAALAIMTAYASEATGHPLGMPGEPA